MNQPQDFEALETLVRDAFRTLEMSARNQAAGARARGDVDRADYFTRRGDAFRNKPLTMLSIVLEHNAHGLEGTGIRLDVAEA